MSGNKTYAMDKQTPGASKTKNIKYIAKSYKPNGDIIYYKDGENADGFSSIIEDLQSGNETLLLSNKSKMKATFEFLEELKYSVENTTLKILFKDKDTTEEVVFSF